MGYAAGREATYWSETDAPEVEGRWANRPLDEEQEGRQFIVRLLLAERGTERVYEWADNFAPLGAITEILPQFCEMMASEPGEDSDNNGITESGDGDG